MAMDDALDGSQPDPGALELVNPMQTLKHTKQLVDVLHFKTCAVVPDEYLDLIVLYVGPADLDFGRRPRACELDRIGQQVRQDHFQHGTVAVAERERSDRP